MVEWIGLGIGAAALLLTIMGIVYKLGGMGSKLDQHDRHLDRHDDEIKDIRKDYVQTSKEQARDLALVLERVTDVCDRTANIEGQLKDK